jgi:hypothetical protein
MRSTTLFTTYEDLPRATENGFTVVDCPAEIWKKILEIYELAKQEPHTEGFPGKDEVIHGGETGIFRLDFHERKRDVIHRALQPLHEEWAKRDLIPSAVYGIRSYYDGTSLIMHRDIVQTHHISSIIIVDTDERLPWPLHIEDHDGNEHKIYTKPGQIILYESATCLHGRPTPFAGNYYNNFYVHYKFAGLDFVEPAKEN